LTRIPFFSFGNVIAIKATGSEIRIVSKSERCQSEPQVVGPASFRLAMAPERIWGTFNLTCQEDAEEVIKRMTALKAFLKPGPKEAAN
jgi:hypothetical protein